MTPAGWPGPVAELPAPAGLVLELAVLAMALDWNPELGCVAMLSDVWVELVNKVAPMTQGLAGFVPALVPAAGWWAIFILIGVNEVEKLPSKWAGVFADAPVPPDGCVERGLVRISPIAVSVRLHHAAICNDLGG